MEERIKTLEITVSLICEILDERLFCNETLSDDKFIKLTNYDEKPLYLLESAITGLRRIEHMEPKPYTRIHLSDGKQFSVMETPEEILESLGHKRNVNEGIKSM